MKKVEDKQIHRIRILFNPMDNNDSKAAMDFLLATFGESRFVYSVGQTKNPQESVITAEGV